MLHTQPFAQKINTTTSSYRSFIACQGKVTRALQRLALLITGFACISCSMRRFAMKHHEFFATQFASKALDLDHKQRDEFRQHWNTFTKGTAHNHIPKLVSSIETMANSEDPLATMDTIQADIRAVLVDACKDFSPLVAKLRPEQIKRLRDRLEERNEKFDPEKHGGLAKFRQSKLKEQTEASRRWLGHLNAKQELLLKDLDQQKDPNGQWEQSYLVYSREAQDAFIAIVTNSAGAADEIQRKCASFVTNPDLFLTPASQKTKITLTEYRKNTLGAIFSTLETKQRDHLQQELGSIANDMRDWSKLVVGDSSGHRPD
jgi:hypothetical protein